MVKFKNLNCFNFDFISNWHFLFSSFDYLKLLIKITNKP